jgi:mannosyltransferase OCH1-like enzyme
MIPKTIHYCWFGRNPKPKLANKCIKSWKKYCNGYNIIEWNEDNFDISSAPLYVRQAYDAKKWAFVSDYVRLYAMVNYGGIYMDTDVEVIKPLSVFLNHKAFSGFESEKDISTGIMACEKGFPLFKEFLEYYDDAIFVNQDGSYNITTNVIIMTNICSKYGLTRNNSLQIVRDFVLYPKDVFCPISYETNKLEKTDKTVTIHWFAGSWKDAEGKKYHKRFILLSKIFGEKKADKISGIIGSIKREKPMPYIKRHIKREK